MKIETHNLNYTKIAEVTSDETIINTTEDGLDLLGNLYYHGFDRIVILEKNIKAALVKVYLTLFMKATKAAKSTLLLQREKH